MVLNRQERAMRKLFRQTFPCVIKEHRIKTVILHIEGRMGQLKIQSPYYLKGRIWKAVIQIVSADSPVRRPNQCRLLYLGEWFWKWKTRSSFQQAWCHMVAKAVPWPTGKSKAANDKHTFTNQCGLTSALSIQNGKILSLHLLPLFFIPILLLPLREHLQGEPWVIYLNPFRPLFLFW